VKKTFAAITAAGAAAAALPLLVLAGCGGSSNSAANAAASTPVSPPPSVSAPAKAGVVDVVLGGHKEFSLTPSAAGVSAGTVTFRVRNAGRVVHEMVVIRTDTKATALAVGTAEVDESRSVGEVADLEGGSVKPLKVKLKAGHYALICNLPGHYAGGMRADFVVR
jgi:uncharacterized cupredoxin-like copper-binding protein